MCARNRMWTDGMACCLLAVGMGVLLAATARAADTTAEQLRLVPFPKQVQLVPGEFELNQPLVLETSLPADAAEIQCLQQELQRARLPRARRVERPEREFQILLHTGPVALSDEVAFRDDATAEDYLLDIRGDTIRCQGHGAAGRFYAVQTLCQLIRANRVGTKIPCLSIQDWPSLRWRCFQDDLTRGPSSKLATLQEGIDLGAYLKLNMFTYYMEYQYAFEKHPEIGPADGSLTPGELRTLVKDAAQRQMEVLGNQQSFGHFGRILKHEQFAELRENPNVLCPVKEGTYELLDDLYSEVCPILPFEMFNVCCDETWGLGEGPSKQLAQQIGTGGVYVQHIRRVHDLLRDKYNKRMMMWGDIILQHPDKLDQIPRDTVMLTWGYGAQDSFEDQILPFKASGYEFFVCPGISNWSRILPDFGVATTNIQNFVRDGARNGAIGMLNTDWEDDGESLQGYRWHGHAWGAECAWNASMTTPEQFNRRVGAVLFGESGDHFGRAIELLGQSHRLPGMQGMLNRRFWEHDFVPMRKPRAIERSAKQLLDLVTPAIKHLQTCQQEATVHAELLDSFLLGARRMQWMATRTLDGLRAAEMYAAACRGEGGKALSELGSVEQLVRANRDELVALGAEFERIWQRESKPYALDWTMDRYASLVGWYNRLLEKLAAARQAVAEGRALPTPDEIGLALPRHFARQREPQRLELGWLSPTDPWLEPHATHRIGLTVAAGEATRADLPVELELVLPAGIGGGAVKAFCQLGPQTPVEVLAQLDPVERRDGHLLTILLPGPLPAREMASVMVYFGLDVQPDPLHSAVRTTGAGDGMHWIENDQIRLLLAPEGAHLYRWQVKAWDDRDLTFPGLKDWAGFTDTGHATRHTIFRLDRLRSGPAVVEYRCVSPHGLQKTIRCFGGTSWIEVDLDEAVTYYWDFDNPDNFAADGPTPGQYLFSSGEIGAVASNAKSVGGQVKAAGQRWAVKYNDEGLMMGLLTPETEANYVVGPGAGAGGVGIENSPPASHLVTVAGEYDKPPGGVMRRLAQTLDYRDQPIVVLYAVQPRTAFQTP